jgi:hypothetical protein
MVNDFVTYNTLRLAGHIYLSYPFDKRDGFSFPFQEKLTFFHFIFLKNDILEIPSAMLKNPGAPGCCPWTPMGTLVALCTPCLKIVSSGLLLFQSHPCLYR